MKTRIAIGLVLVLAVFAAGPGAAFAQISDSGQASEVQYPDAPTPAANIQEEPEADEGLPVTGFVAIPLLLTGAVLLVVGGVMHVRTRGD